MMKSPLSHSILSLSLIPFLLFIASSYSQRQVYIVYLGDHKEAKTAEATHEHHHSFLLSVKNSEAEARESLLYSYKNTINGFAAFLSEDEAAELSGMEEVVSAFQSEGRSFLHTTRSWEFVGIEEGLNDSSLRDWLPIRANFRHDVIVGMLDSGIWPESKSFADREMGPIPKRWKGICEEGDDFTASSCNKKVIGARYYTKGYEAYYGPINRTYSYRSSRDSDGHGTHTASTVAGCRVPSVSALGGFARGAASGGAPLARLAVYKVCWPIPGPSPNLENTCFDADMLAAFDDAVSDGVDVISMSVGASGQPPKFSKDSIAIGALHATRRGVVVACSAGNSGPAVGTVVNLAPWIVTVGASSIDRVFASEVVLGNGMKIEGQTVTPCTLKKGIMYPLIYAGNAQVPGTPTNASGQCLPNSLSPRKTKSKVVVCFRGLGFRAAKGMEVKRVGGAAIILANAPSNGAEIPVDAHVLPAAGVSSTDAATIMTYINSKKKPTVTIGRAFTDLGVAPAPVMAAFSSRGPNRVEPSILKPDVTAPGLNILAAWSASSGPTKLDGDDRRVQYNLMSGTSMACPHVGATAALLKAVHPSWSSAAIRSAIMTTATTTNAVNGPITTASDEVAGPMDFGSGHIRPNHAADPGLIYDAKYEDYLLFACSSIKAQMDPTFPCPLDPPLPSNLNYPSVTVAGLNGTVKLTRTVTNVGQGKAPYRVRVKEPTGVRVRISPTSLKFTKVGQMKKFVIKLAARGKGSGGYVGGEFSWSDGVHSVRSPIVVSFM